MSGGVQLNVVPNQFTVGFDIRITPTTDIEQFEEMIRQWAKEVRINGFEIWEFILLTKTLATDL